MLQSNWFGILHYVVNEHQWLLSYNDYYKHNKCNHEPLPEKRKTLYSEKESDAYNALPGIVMNTRLLNNIHYYLSCR